MNKVSRMLWMDGAASGGWRVDGRGEMLSQEKATMGSLTRGEERGKVRA